MAKRLIVAGLALVLAAGGGIGWWLSQERAAPAGAAQAVVVNQAGNLELVAADGTRRPLTSAASSRLRYTQVTPAPDGAQVAYVEATLAGARVLVQPLAGGEPRSLFDDAKQNPFYLAWSPDSRWLTFLASDADMHLFVAAADGSAKAQEIRAGQPSYFAWTPDSSRLLMHIGGASPGGAIFQRSTADGKLETLRELAGDFQTPGWDAAGSARVVVTTDGERNQLVRIQGDASAELTPRTADAILFSVAPNHEQVAYVRVGEDGRSPLQVVAAGGGESKQVAESAPLAFFWSPDSARIALLVLESRGVGPSGGAGIVFVAQPAELPRLHWQLVDLAAGTTKRFPPFDPSPEFANLLPYFDQYATSLAFWSPSGDRLIYGTQTGVMSLRISDGTITTLGDGGYGVWLPR